MSIVLRIVVAGLIVGLLLAAPVAAQDPCDDANFLRNERLFDQAEARYNAVLDTDRSQRCAVTGLDAIAVQRAAAGEALARGEARERAGLTTEARQAYAEALRIDPSLESARSKLAGLLAPSLSPSPSPSPSPDEELAAIRRLAEIGLKDEAKEKLKDLLDEEPGTRVPDDFEPLLGGGLPGFGLVQSWITAFGRTFGAFLLDAAILLIFCAILGSVLRYIWPSLQRTARMPRLKIQSFNKGATDLDIGDALAAQIEDALTQNNDRGPRPLVHLVGGPTVAFDLPTEIKSFAPVLNVLTAFVDFLVRRDQVTLTGHLHAPGARGAGLTISLEQQSGKILNSTTLWYNAYDDVRREEQSNSPPATAAPKDTKTKQDPADYYLLTSLAAAWTLFQLGQLRRNLFVQKETTEQVPAATPRPAITPHPESDVVDRAFARSLMAEDWLIELIFLIGRALRTLARMLYRVIIIAVTFPVVLPVAFVVSFLIRLYTGKSADPWWPYSYILRSRDSSDDEMADGTEDGSGNTFSLLGTRNWESYTFYLAGVHWTEESQTLSAIRAYTEALNRDPSNLAARVNLGILLLYQAARDTHKKDAEHDVYRQAEFHLQQATRRIQKEYEERRNDPALTYVAFFQFAAIFEYRSRLYPYDSDETRNEINEAIKHSGFLKNAIDKDLAERVKLPHRLNLFASGRREALKRYDDNRLAYLSTIKPMVHVIHAVHLSYRNTAADASLASEIVKEIETRSLTYRAHYNLACYYSVRGELVDSSGEQRRHYEKALRHLQEALMYGGQIVAWAKIDLSLCGVRGDRRWPDIGRPTPSKITEAFKKLVARYDGTPPPSSRGSFDLAWTPRPKVTNGTEVKART